MLIALSASACVGMDTKAKPFDLPVLRSMATSTEETVPVNYLLGFNWDFSKTWSVMAEAGIGGSRQSFISAVTFRF